jgi:hypothetical protein
MATANPLLPALLDDPVVRALDRAPLGEPFMPEQRAELDQAMADIAAGRVKLVPHADVQRALEEMRREQGG